MLEANAQNLSSAERQRYVRHLGLPEVGEAGQQRLRNAAVLLVGTGGLGSPAALYLAAAGIGRLGLIDFDRVEASNLQRQVLFGEACLGQPKVEAARARLLDLNPHTHVEVHPVRLDARNAQALFLDYDWVVDGSDNFATRYVVNDTCVRLGKVFVHASVSQFRGQLSTFDATSGPCYRCVFPSAPPPHAMPNCAEAGVLGVLPGIMGTLQAAEVLKLVLGVGEPLVGRLQLFDALSGRFREIGLQKNLDCAVCGEGPRLARSREDSMNAQNVLSLTAAELKTRLDSGDDFFLLDVREPDEVATATIGGYGIPLRELPQRLSEIPRDKDVVIYCHHGVRSLHALHFLREQGFTRARHLSGGIEAWSLQVDPSVRRY